MLNIQFRLCFVTNNNSQHMYVEETNNKTLLNRVTSHQHPKENQPFWFENHNLASANLWSSAICYPQYWTCIILWCFYARTTVNKGCGVLIFIVCWNVMFCFYFSPLWQQKMLKHVISYGVYYQPPVTVTRVSFHWHYLLYLWLKSWGVLAAVPFSVECFRVVMTKSGQMWSRSEAMSLFCLWK